MIAVDSSVWVDHFRGRDLAHTEALARLLSVGSVELVVPDLVLFEVTRGFTVEREQRLARTVLQSVGVVTTGGEALALAAAQHYRALRAVGVSIRSAMDVLIAAWCIEHDCHLLHNDRDFDAFAAHRGLRVWQH